MAITKPAIFRKSVGRRYLGSDLKSIAAGEPVTRGETKPRRDIVKAMHWQASQRGDLLAFATHSGRLWRVTVVGPGRFQAEMHNPSAGSVARWPNFPSVEKAKGWCETVADSLAKPRGIVADSHGEV